MENLLLGVEHTQNFITKKEHYICKFNRYQKTIKYDTRRALLDKISIEHLNLHRIREAVTL